MFCYYTKGIKTLHFVEDRVASLILGRVNKWPKKRLRSGMLSFGILGSFFFVLVSATIRFICLWDGVLHIQVARVKEVQSYISILSTAGITSSIRIDVHYARQEMTEGK